MGEFRLESGRGGKPRRLSALLILGLDPGSLHTGYGLVESDHGKIRSVGFGRFSCPPKAPLPQRLGYLSRELRLLIDSTQPDSAVMETSFHGPNTRSLIVLAQARGALLAVLGKSGLEVREYSPAEIKMAVVGNGRADKRQVAHMVRLLLTLGDQKASEDATDALAVAICYAHRHKLEQLEQGF